MTTNLLRVLIVDDEPSRSKGWADGIKELLGSNAEVVALELPQSRVAIEAADSRRREARRGLNPFTSATACILDDVDILVLDYDLQELVETGTWSTGLWVAMLARAFSRVKLIVLVNQFGPNRFDLTQTRAVESRADVDIGEGQLLNPALWDRSRIEAYMPWAWNDGLIGASARVEAAVDWTRSRLDRSVLTELGFSVDSHSSDTTTFIAPELWQLCLSRSGLTFRELVREADFLPIKDREAVGAFDELCARVSAAIIMHWLDRWVIPANEVLIDLPHLVSAYPWLLRRRQDIDDWQAAAVQNGFDALLSEVSHHVFKPGFPVSRETVWKQKIINDPALAEPSGFVYDGFPDLVFCEDTSRFLPFSNARSFLSKLPGADPQRFVADPNAVTSLNRHFSPNAVAYEPSVLFAL